LINVPNGREALRVGKHFKTYPAKEKLVCNKARYNDTLWLSGQTKTIFVRL